MHLFWWLLLGLTATVCGQSIGELASEVRLTTVEYKSMPI